MVSPGKLYTVEEFEKFTGAHSDRLFELVNGVIVERHTTAIQNAIVANLMVSLGMFIALRRLGRVAAQACHCVEGDNHNARVLDIAFTGNVRNRPVTQESSLPRLPDLAIEVKSPDDTDNDLSEKAAYCLENGVTVVWLVYPKQKQVEIHTQDADPVTLTGNAVITGGELLPDFEITLKDIFPE